MTRRTNKYVGNDEDRLYEPAPGPTLWLLARFAESLPTRGHTDAFNAISAAGLLQLKPVAAEAD